MIRRLKTLAIPAMIADILYLIAVLIAFQHLLYELSAQSAS